MLGWRHSGFSVHNQVRVAAQDAEGRKKLAGYMLRAPMSLEKMSYDAETGTVIYRSKMHLGLKRNFQVMPGAEWLELLCRHIPDRYEHLVRYVGALAAGALRPAGFCVFDVTGIAHRAIAGAKWHPAQCPQAHRSAQEHCDRRECERRAGLIYLSVSVCGAAWPIRRCSVELTIAPPGAENPPARNGQA